MTVVKNDQVTVKFGFVIILHTLEDVVWLRAELLSSSSATYG